MRATSLLVPMLVLSIAAVTRAGDLWGDPPPPPQPRPAIQWRGSLDEARQEAIRSGRLLLVADGNPNSAAWSDSLTALLAEQFVCVVARQRWIEEDEFPIRRRNIYPITMSRLWFCTSDGFVLDALDGIWPSDAIEQEARWTLEAVRSMTRGGAAVERGEAVRALSRQHSEEAARLARNDPASPRIAFHQQQAANPLANVATLVGTWLTPPPRRGG